MPGLRGDDPTLRRKVVADLVKSRSKGGMRAAPRSGGTKAAGKISDVAQVRSTVPVRRR